LARAFATSLARAASSETPAAEAPAAEAPPAEAATEPEASKWKLPARSMSLLDALLDDD